MTDPLPMTSRPGRCPSASRSTRSAPATASRTSRRWSRPRSRPSSSSRLVAAGLPIVEATSFVHPKWVPQLADAAELMTLARRRPGRHLPVLVPNERGLDRALELGVRHIAIFGSATETFAQRNLNRSLDEQFAMFEPTVPRAPRGGARRPRLRLHVLRRPLGGRRADRAGGRRSASGCFDLGASQLSLGDTIGVGTAGHVTRPARRVQRRGAARRPARDALPRHLRPGARQHATPPCGTASPRSTPAPAGSAAARTPRARPATSRPRTSSGCCPASASRPASTSAPWSPPAAGWPRGSGVPAPSGVVTALADERRHNPHDGRRRLPARGSPKTRHHVPAGPAARQPGALARHGVHYPWGRTTTMFQAALDLIDQRWGGQRDGARGEWDALAERVRRAPGTVRDQPRDPRRRRAGAGEPGDARPRGRTRCTSSYSARDIARQVPAEWQERVKHRNDAPTGASSSGCAAPSGGTHLWFWQVQGLPDVLNRWGQGLPAGGSTS